VTIQLKTAIIRIILEDKLSLLLQRFSLSAGVFHVGQICGVLNFAQDATHGHLHLIKQGPAQLIDALGTKTMIHEPTLIFLPRPDAHRLVADDRHGAEVVCANILFGMGGLNPITSSLPSMLLIKLEDLPGARAWLSLVDEEAFCPQLGRQAALDRLCEVLMIHLLRHCLKHGLTQGGTLAGLAHAKLSKALHVMHAKPAHLWQLHELAEVAGMSRARFAAHFRVVTGQTPGDYLATWRVLLAQEMLQSGRALKHVALDVGYGSVTAFSRFFARKVGCTPTVWMEQEIARRI
jgi:AraC-like DNA-binding protein